MGLFQSKLFQSIRVFSLRQENEFVLTNYYFISIQSCLLRESLIIFQNYQVISRNSFSVKEAKLSLTVNFSFEDVFLPRRCRYICQDESCSIPLTFDMFIISNSILNELRKEKDMFKSIFHTRIVFTMIVISLLTIFNYLFSFRPNVWIVAILAK